LAAAPFWSQPYPAIFRLDPGQDLMSKRLRGVSPSFSKYGWGKIIKGKNKIHQLTCLYEKEKNLKTTHHIGHK
jgi:hypothetical protein